MGNSYIDVYKYFCKPKPEVKTVKQMYNVGLELQQKLDKIIDYDRCNPDTAKTMGMKEYCKELFKDQKFYFWQGNEVEKTCDNIKTNSKYDKEKDECAVLNDHIFGEYHKQQKKVLTLVEEFTSN